MLCYLLVFDKTKYIIIVRNKNKLYFQALGHPGWCVGMLADGTTGLYHQSYVEESLVKEQTHI